MKKLLVTLALAGTLSVPSVVFSEATWYGSLRGGLQSGGGADGQYFDGGSRWGIKGSAEVSDGLTAVYRFEHKISTSDGGQPGGRLAYAGLSGGFGTISVGQIWNAAYNHVGAITDKSYYFGDAGTGYRHGNAVSYAFSSGAVGFQVDLASDGSKKSGKAIDKTEFGVTVGLGEIGKVAIAHTSMQNYPVTKEVFDPGSHPTLNQGSFPTLDGGSFPTLDGGSFPTLDGGSFPTLDEGSFPTLDEGSFPTLDEGSFPTLNPGAYPQTKYKDVDVIPVAESVDATKVFNLELDSEGNLTVADATRWVATGIIERKTAEVKDKMHKTRVANSATGDGALDVDADLTAGTHAARDATPVILEHSESEGTFPTTVNQGALANLYDRNVDENGQITYTLKACAEAATTCFKRPAFVVEYRGGAGIDPDTGTAPKRVTFVPGNSAEISHTAKTEEPDGTDDGTPPALNTDGELPSLNMDGELPSLNDDGVLPSLNDDGVLPSLNDDGVLPSLNDDGVLPSLNDDGVLPTLDAGRLPGFVNETTTMYGHKATHVAVEFGLGGVTPYVGYSEKKMNNSAAKSKTTHYGISGSLGDTGMSYLVAGRSVTAASGGKTSPWLFNVSKGLGGGATVIFEHGNSDDGNSGKSRVGLHVTF